MASDFDITPTDGPLGAYVERWSARKELDADAVRTLREALWTYSVLILRDKKLTESEQVAFSRMFCDPIPHPANQSHVGSLPEITLISNVKKDGRVIGALGHNEVLFHSDLTFRHELGTVSTLFSVETPVAGGETSWSSGYAAYDALDEEARERFQALRIVYTHAIEAYRPEKPAVHPLVVTHPDSGRKSLYFSASHAVRVADASEEESQETIDFLIAHTADERFIWTHAWWPGDLAVWDNRCAQHRRNEFDPNARRIMRRTQAVGSIDEPAADTHREAL